MDPTSFFAAFALHREPPTKADPPSPPAASAPAVPGPDDAERARDAMFPILRDMVSPAVRPSGPCPEDAPAPAPDPKPAPKAEPKPKPTPKPTPTSWRLADRSGQVWTHPNKAYLESWVAARDAASAPTYRAPYYPYQAGGCANGRCSR